MLPVLAALAAGGCRSEARPELQPVHGLMAINGKPAAGAMFVLHPADGKAFDSRGTRPKATVNPDGTFDLTTYQSGDGAPVGEYEVAVLWLADPDSDDAWDRLGGRLADPKWSGVRVTVAEGQDELEPIRLDGVTVLDRRPQPSPPDHDQVD